MQQGLGDLTAMLGKVHAGLSSDGARLRAAFGKVLYLHLAREDQLAQAVSLVKAEQTGLWHLAPDGTELERLSPPRPPAYDFARIAARLEDIRRQDAAWRAWFADQRIAPLRIAYETLSADPHGTVARIAAALGVRLTASASPAPGVAKLADAVSLDWIARFRAEAGTAP